MGVLKRLHDLGFRVRSDASHRLLDARLRRLERTFREAPATELGPGVLIVPPSVPGSVGDDAMMRATVDTLRADGHDDLAIVSFDERQPWTIVADVPVVVDVHDFIYGRDVRKLEALAGLRARYGRLLLLGADVLDGHYSEELTVRRIWIARLAAALGMATSILGFSLNARPSPRTLDAFRALQDDVQLNLRDPVSRQRLASLCGREGHQVADLAFLLEPAADRRAPVESVVRWIEGAERTIGLNLNNLVSSDDDAQVARRFTGIVARVFEAHPDLQILFVPHDYRASNKDLDMGIMIRDALPEAVRDRFRILEGVYSPGEVKAIASHLFAAVSCRMHFAIACLGVATPVHCLEYQGKFEGLFQLFGLDGGLLSLRSDVSDDALYVFVDGLLEHRDALHAQIRSALPSVRTLSHANFHQVRQPAPVAQ